MVTRIVRTATQLGRTTVGAGLLLTGMSSVALAFVADTPEIDAGSAASALALVSGGVMLLRDWFRAK
jgi:hypothetical protein